MKHQLLDYKKLRFCWEKQKGRGKSRRANVYHHYNCSEINSSLKITHLLENNACSIAFWFTSKNLCVIFRLNNWGFVREVLPVICLLSRQVMYIGLFFGLSHTNILLMTISLMGCMINWSRQLTDSQIYNISESLVALSSIYLYLVWY